MQNRLAYDVLIYCCDKGMRFAKALHHALRRYRVPADFADEVKNDVTVRHVDRFKVCPLCNICDENAEKSDFLIVVCSPVSVEEGEQEAEKLNVCVENFIAAGRKDKIIPVVVGEDGANSLAYIPNAIAREKIPLVRLASRNRKEFRKVLLTVVCRMLNLQPKQFERLVVGDSGLRQRRNRMMAGVLAALLAGLFFIDSERTVLKFYANYVDSYGLPEGISPLDAAELERRNIHYRFEYEGFQFGSSPHADSADWCVWNLFGMRRKLVRVVQANSHGYPARSLHPEHVSRPEIQHFLYDGNRLRKIDMFHHSRDELKPELEGSVLFSNLSPDTAENVFGCRREIVNGSLLFSTANGNLANFDGRCIQEAASQISRLAGISRHFICRDAFGREEKRLFLNAFHNNVPDRDGVYGYQSEYDGLGRPIIKRILGRKAGTIARNVDYHGIGEIRFHYNQGNLIRIEYCAGLDAAATDKSNAAAICTYDYDSFGNNIRCRVVNGNDEIAFCGKENSGFDAAYDDFGNLEKLLFVRTAKEQTTADNGNKPDVANAGYVEIRREYDECGNIVKESFFDSDGNLAFCEEGFATVRFEYEGYGNPTKVSYFGLDDMPVLHKDGNAGFVYHVCPDYSCTLEAFDTEHNSISSHLVATVADVFPGLPAENSGIKAGDIICRFGMYDMLEAGNACEAFMPIQASKRNCKDVFLARKVNGDYEIRQYRFPAGMIGIETGAKYIYDNENLVRAYAAFRVGLDDRHGTGFQAKRSQE